MGFFKRKDISSYSDEQLMQEIERGHSAAFDLLYERYSEKLYRYLFRLLNNDRERAEDFLQEVFLKVLNSADSFDATKSVSTWLYTIATNLCRNEWRNTSNRQRLMKTFEPWEHHSSKTVNEKIDEKYRNKLLDAVMNELENEDREILQLRFQQEFSIREIAAIAGLPEGTVKSRIFYLLKKLAKQLKSNSIEL
ncbi:MAG: sigma-70 family RNA polymerase sigma factor [Chitinophagaceae bacterium]